jgi:hypothetical protein
MRNRLARIVVASAAVLACDGALALDTSVPPGGLPSAAHYSGQLLLERSDVVSWKSLAQVEHVKQGDRMVPAFAGAILALDEREARVQGFMIPLDMGDRQKHFLISAVPVDCPFCLPAGPEAVVEVLAKDPVGYTLDPIIVAGRFAVLKDDPNGVLYRLTGATQIGTASVSRPAPPGVPGRAARSD